MATDRVAQSQAGSAGTVRVQVVGAADFMAKMSTLPDKLREQALKKIFRESMRITQRAVQAATPALSKPVLRNGYPIRLPQTVRKAIKVRLSRQEAKDGNVGVFVNVKPLRGNVYKRAGSYIDKTGTSRKAYALVKKSQRSADNPRDPFFWRWIEFGTKVRKTKRGANRGAMPAFRMLHKSAGSLTDAVKDATRRLQAWLEKANTTGKIE